MKKTTLLALLLMFSIQLLKAQSVFVKAGKNINKYNFNGREGDSPTLNQEMGQTFELGYLSKPVKNTLFSYGISAGLSAYNASGAYVGTNLVWETTFASVKGWGYYPIFKKNRNEVLAKAGFGVATLINGWQQIDGTRYNLLKEKEFNGVFVTPQLGLMYRFAINSNTSLLIDYDYGRQYTLTNNGSQHLSFRNHGLSVGFSTDIK